MLRKFKFASWDGRKTISISDAKTLKDHREALKIYPDSPDVTVVKYSGNFTQEQADKFAADRNLIIVQGGF